MAPSPHSDEDFRGVIWITGYSASGKTTIGREVERELRQRGHRTIFLDGDHLRSILGRRWGFEREDRVELSQINLRLCSHLASQGAIVIFSAIALYDEAAEWFHRNIPRGVQIYLNVPEDERRRRDAQTKQVYTQETSFESVFDMPDLIDRKIDNFNVSPQEVAEEVIDLYLNQAQARADYGRARFWDEFYQAEPTPGAVSSFAELVRGRLTSEDTVIEVGCGLGSDSAYLAQGTKTVIGLDTSVKAIELCRRHHGLANLTFRHSSLSDFEQELECQIDAIYCRFALNEVPLGEELGFLEAAKRLLKPNGKLLLECRSIKDPVSRKGEVISPTERLNGHYRRYLIFPEFTQRIVETGFTLTDSREERGLCPDLADTAIVIRVEAVQGESTDRSHLQSLPM